MNVYRLLVKHPGFPAPLPVVRAICLTISFQNPVTGGPIITTGLFSNTFSMYGAPFFSPNNFFSSLISFFVVAKIHVGFFSPKIFNVTV